MSWTLVSLTRAAFCSLLVLLSLVAVSSAQFKVNDNFNRADGDVGLGWSPWGNGAQISGDQLETFGELAVAGGIARKLDVTFPLNFSFDFSTDAPPNGGWEVGFNAATANAQGPSDTSEFGVEQSSGRRGVCVFFQTSSGQSSQCFGVVSGQRDYTAKAHISAIVNADFTAKITIKYNDGLSPARVTIKTTSPAGALTFPQGSLLIVGNISEDFGPHFFDNFMLDLM
jgi:hypothetical protein